MAQRPPPFAALRALEAACRHRNYTAAAAELNVTHSAVSQAIRRLEDEMGCKLFVRRGAAMEPSSASMALARAYADASLSVSQAMRHITESAPNAVNLATPPTIARQFLLPLLARLQARFPTLSLRLKTEADALEDVDVLVRIGEPPSGARAIKLENSRIRAYASPDLIRMHRIETAMDVARVGILIQRDEADWSNWFGLAGLSASLPQTLMRFEDQSGLAMETAAQGLGVVLANSLAAAPFVERGALAPICAQIVIPGPTLWASWSIDHPRSETIGPMVEWWAQEVAFLVASAEDAASSSDPPQRRRA